MSSFTINHAGLRATLQDNGRKKSQHLGLSQGGAADLHGFRWANKLLDNSPDAAAIEILLGQFTMTADTATFIAVTGAVTELMINDHPAELWQTHSLEAGDRVSLGEARQGMLNYIAVKGGWQTEQFCGSRTTVIREKIPGFSPLTDGDLLPIAPLNLPASAQNIIGRRVPRRHRPDYGTPLTLRFVPGYQYENFSAAARRQFNRQIFQISNRIDRMGYLLEGEAIAPPEEPLLSEGIAMGAIQVPGNGQPVILLNDRQTMGGYQKPGCVPALDCSQLCQRGPGAPIRFRLADLAGVQNERMLFEAFFARTRWVDCSSLRWM